MTFHVAIIGGGTGGLCLAHGLREAGISVAVYERSRTRTERLQGYRVHLNPHGAAALHECLPPKLWRRFVETTSKRGGDYVFLTEQLTELMRIENELSSSPDPVNAHHGVSRITLHQVLSSGLEDVLHYDKTFVRYEQKDRVVCHFEDGTTAEADLVIGADGANSRVRKQFLPYAKRVDTGIRAIAGKFPLTDETRKLVPARLIDGPNSILPPRGCGFFTAPHEFDGGENDGSAEVDDVLFDNTGSYVMWAYGASTRRYADGLSEMDGAALKRAVLDQVEAWHPAFVRMVSESPEGSISLMTILTSEPVEPWPTSSVTLLGDAIHSMTPMRGIGANTALRDAQLLCRYLVAASFGDMTVAEAVSLYEARMRDYGFEAVRTSLKAAEQFVSENRVGRTMAKSMFRFIEAVPPLKRRMFADQKD
ncbi:FAD-dependent oxidoreductase [Amycolatopsis sp. cg5]|uniref:FAD-dependent oxidoreductase n=1 Tax=Amycolatopsis sp. cg5 TaxID=3238802 RepID=UPI003524BE18